MFTLRMAYQQYHKSESHRRRTVEKFGNLLDWWERLTEDPSVTDLTNETLHRFRESLLGRLRPTTVNPLLSHLRAILATIGPAGPGNPYGLGLIGHVPCVRRVKERALKPRIVPDEILAVIYGNCTSATWPRVGIDPTAWWRALIVFLYNVGLRRNDFRGLRMSDVSLTRGCLKLMAEKDGQQDRLVPLHQCVVEHLVRIWLPQRGLVFPMTKRFVDAPGKNPPKQLYEQWYKIQERAGVTKPYYVFHELRKTCGTKFYEQSPAAAQAMLGHSSVETTRKFYANTDRILVETAKTLDQPWGAKADHPAPDSGRPALRVVG